VTSGKRRSPLAPVANSDSEPAPAPPLSAWIATAVAVLCAALLARTTWMGGIGWGALAPLVIGAAAYGWARTHVTGPTRARWDLCAKFAFTVLGFVALLRHPIAVDGAPALPVYAAIAQYVTVVDGTRFLLFTLLAMGIKFTGVIASAFAWHLLLIGQRIRFPFWSAILTSFLIGRFIGTFLPSTLGLDGYTLYEASRYSSQWSRAVTAKALEKIIGISGLFLGMLLTLPLGYAVIVDVATGIDRPETAPILAAAIAVVAGGIVACVLIGLAWPRLLTAVVALPVRLAPPAWRATAQRFEEAAGAYRGRFGLLLAALACKFVAHFSTATVYYFTALAIGVTAAAFWPITFGSTIQILATVLSPTIAGEGAREAFQALLLSKQLGGVAQAVLSASLGFIAAEAATLWGGAFLWTRTPQWRPSYCRVDGRQVDYASLTSAANP